jgi:glycosyltransferase involved in cell wall biosynthesis
MSEVTIAIPFYSGLDYLRGALDSLRAQTCPDWLGIVVDDAGPDPEARQLVAGYADDRLTYVRNETNLGLAGNWNTCLRIAETEYVTLFHADDELEPIYVALVLAGHHAHPGAVAVYPRARVVDATGKRLLSPPDMVKRFTAPRKRGNVIVLEGDDGLASLLWGQHIFCPAVSYKRSLLGPEPFDRRWRQVLDLDVLARLLLDGQQIVGLDEVGYVYRRHAEQLTSQHTKDFIRFEEEFAVYDEIGAKAKAADWRRTTRVADQGRILKAHVLYRSLALLLHGDAASSRAALHFLRHRGSRQTNP